MIYYQEPHATLYQGDALEVLSRLPSESVDMCVTSPPYYGLREYGMDGQIGLEKTPEEYVAKLVAIFREVRRVLKKEGTMWLNLGDSYCGSTSETPSIREDSPIAAGTVLSQEMRSGRGNRTRAMYQSGLKPKDLIGIPWKTAQALQAPYYTGRIARERDRVWLAAMIDAEGTICGFDHDRADDGSHRSGLHLTITNTSTTLLDEAARIWPTSRSRHQRPYAGHLGTMDSWRWIIHGIENKMAAIRELYPYLIVKRQQAIVGYTLLTLMADAKRLGHSPQKDSVLAKRRVLTGLLSDLNHQRPVILPDWLIEPPSMYEPGYYLRQDIIWSKPNPMPESVTDRCSKSHEYIFLLAKSAKYYYDAEAIKEKTVTNDNSDRDRDNSKLNNTPGRTRMGGLVTNNYELRNKRSVWEITTQPYSAKKSISFALADYVGHDGKPYKASEDCPVHGPMLRSGMFDRVANGGRLIHLGNHNLDNDNRHVSSQSSLPSAKTSHTHSATSESSTQRQTSESMTENKTLDHRPGYKLHEGTVDHNGHKLKSYESQDDNLDLQPHENVRSAKVRSKRSHKTGHVPVTNPSCNSSEGNAPHTDGKLIQSLMTGLDSSIPVNNNEQGDSSAHPSVQIPDHNVRISSQEQSYCKCKIMSIDHFATYPPALVEPCILAGTSLKGVCPDCGKAWERIVEKEGITKRQTMYERGQSEYAKVNGNALNYVGGHNLPEREVTTLGWQPTCKCGKEPTPATVLDPFAGSGTTMAVAKTLNRKSIGIELNSSYCKLAMERIQEVTIPMALDF